MLGIILSAAKSATQLPCTTRGSQTVTSDYWITGCEFYSMSSTTAGGAVYINSSSSTLSANNSIFWYCYSASSGGGFYFLGQSATIYSACGSDCAGMTITWGQGGMFFYSYATVSQQIYLVSESRCSNSSLMGTYGSIVALGGITKCNVLNSSFNSLKSRGSAFLFYSIAYPSVALSNIVNCSTQDYRIAYVDYPTVGFINVSNFIGNSIIDNSSGVIFIYESASGGGYLDVVGCIFSGNTGGPLLSTGGNGVLTAIYCWIDHSYSILYTGTGGVTTTACFIGVTKTITLSEWGSSFSIAFCGFRFPMTKMFTFTTSAAKSIPISLSILRTLLFE